MLGGAHIDLACTQYHWHVLSLFGDTPIMSWVDTNMLKQKLHTCVARGSDDIMGVCLVVAYNLC